MTLNDFMDDMAARAFAAYAESNPRLKELAEKDSDKTATAEEEAEFFRLLDKAESEFYGDDDTYFDMYTSDDESPIDLFGAEWE